MKRQRTTAVPKKEETKINLHHQHNTHLESLRSQLSSETNRFPDHHHNLQQEAVSIPILQFYQPVQGVDYDALLNTSSFQNGFGDPDGMATQQFADLSHADISS